MDKAVFIDRDGTMNLEVGYLDDISRLIIYPQTFTAIKMINDSGMKSIVVTNQSGVARGRFTEDFIRQVHLRMQQFLREHHARVDAFFYCPHHPIEGQGSYRQQCSCRKPGTGMFLRAAESMSIDLAGSYMIGDTSTDIMAAKNAGMRSVLVRTGFGRRSESDMPRCALEPDHVADDILSAVIWILGDVRNEHPSR